MSSKINRIARQVVFDVAPGLGSFTDKTLFADVWEDPALSKRDRSFVTLAALVSLGRYGQIASHTGRALDNGIEPTELGELATQLAFYSGWPNGISAVYEMAKTFEERGIGPVADTTGDLLDLEPAAEASRKAIVAENVAPTAPNLASDTDEVLFKELWCRPELSPRDRSLVTMSALIATGQAEQLGFHVNRALDNGLTVNEAGEVLRHVAYYAGWPRAMSAVGPLKQILASRS